MKPDRRKLHCVRHFRRSFITQDANWNVTTLVGTDGQVKERFLYTSYGERTVLDANWTGTADAYGFFYGHQGGRQDPATGLIHFQARDYNPTLGRWMQQDPAGYVDGMSLYQFVRDNPINCNDPLGLYCGECMGKATTRRFIGLTMTSPGGDPHSRNDAMSLLGSLQNLQAVMGLLEQLQSSGSFASNMAREGIAKALADWNTDVVDGAVHQSHDVSDLITPTVQRFISALYNRGGHFSFDLYAMYEEKTCVPCDVAWSCRLFGAPAKGGEWRTTTVYVQIPNPHSFPPYTGTWGNGTGYPNKSDLPTTDW